MSFTGNTIKKITIQKLDFYELISEFVSWYNIFRCVTFPNLYFGILFFSDLYFRSLD